MLTAESCTPGAVQPNPLLPLSPCHLGVPHHHVSVRVLGDAAFLRVEVEDFGCVAAGDGHKSILVHFAAVLEGEEKDWWGEEKQKMYIFMERNNNDCDLSDGSCKFA